MDDCYGHALYIRLVTVGFDSGYAGLRRAWTGSSLRRGVNKL